MWLYQLPHRAFSAFETIADLYFVRMPRELYRESHPSFWKVRLPFVLTYNWRKLLKHAFGINYKKRCQRRFQRLLAKND